ncbi:hypothetical protein ES703_105931 [subsurface metagenome]
MSEIVDKLVCPECKSTDFLEGPHGGMAVNVKCAKCGYRLNTCPLPDGKIWITDKLGRA